MNILQVKKYYNLVKVGLYNKLSVHILLQEKLQKKRGKKNEIEGQAEKPTKAIENRVKKQIPNTDQNSIKDLYSKDFLTTEV